MKKHNLSVLFILLPIILFSQQNSVLWKIEKDSVASYILGTQHLFGGSFIENDSDIFNALKNSVLIVTENIDSPYTIVEKRSSFNYIEKLSSKEKSKLNEILYEKKNINKLTLKELIGQTDKYWGRFSCLDAGEKKDTVLMDEFVKKYARNNQIKLEGLETVEQTLGAIETFVYPNFSEKQLISILRDKLDKFSDNKSNKNCAIEEEYRTKKYSFDFSRSINVPIITSRNENWLQEIPKLLEDNKKVFIAVGAGHLNFKNGLIEGLKNLGYKVTPVNLQ